MIIFRGTLTLSDYVEALQAAASLRAMRWPSRIFVLCIIAFFAPGVYKSFQTEGSWDGLIPLTILALFWLIYVFLILPLWARKIYWQQRSLREPFELMVHDTGWTRKSVQGESALDWVYVHQWAETKNLFVLYLSDAAFHILPKRFASEENAIEALRALLKTHVSARPKFQWGKSGATHNAPHNVPSSAADTDQALASMPPAKLPNDQPPAPKRQISDWQWLVQGWGCAFGLKPAVEGAQLTPWQFLRLALYANLFIITAQRLFILGSALFSWQDWFISWSITPFLLWFFWLALHLDSKMAAHQKRPPALLGLATWFLLATWVLIPPTLLIYSFSLAFMRDWLPLSRGLISWFWWGGFGVVLLWLLAALTKLACRYLASRALAFIFIILTLGFNLFAQSYLKPIFWSPDYSILEEEEDDRPSLHLSQKIFETQQKLWQTQTAALAPRVEGVSNVYALVFAPYAAEDVFHRESTLVADLLRQRFDAQGRVLHLLNHNTTSDSLPWATPENLERGIAALAAQMNREEDLLLIYMTSHGAKSHELAAQFWPLEVDPVTPTELRSYLDAAGVRNRVLIISACYSGGWIEPLMNDNSLVMSAAAADKTSYGCGHRSKLTFFGRALFDEQLRHTHSFTRAGPTK